MGFRTEGSLGLGDVPPNSIWLPVEDTSVLGGALAQVSRTAVGKAQGLRTGGLAAPLGSGDITGSSLKLSYALVSSGVAGPYHHLPDPTLRLWGRDNAPSRLACSLPLSTFTHAMFPFWNVPTRGPLFLNHSFRNPGWSFSFCEISDDSC